DIIVELPSAAPIAARAHSSIGEEVRPMNDLKKQVKVAHRRLLVQRFLAVLPWTLSTALLDAALAILLPKLTPLGVDTQRWAIVWIAGGVLLGLLLAVAI